MKELVFSRVKAYNLVQMFIFIYDVMDTYYQKKLIAISNHRFDTYVALRFQGINAKIVSKMDISSSANGWYQVRSCTERNKFYEVNVSIGVCTCERGQDGSPCVHQAAVVLNFGIESLNYIATLSANARLKIATIALGDGAVKQLSFYSSLHQSVLEEKYTSVHTSVNDSQEMCSNFEGSAWDLMRSEGDHFVSVSEEKQENISISKLGDEIDDFAKQLKLLLIIKMIISY